MDKMERLLIDVQEQAKEIQEYATVQEARQNNDLEAIFQNQELNLQVQYLNKISAELQTKMISAHNICQRIIEELNPVSMRLNKAIETKENFENRLSEVLEGLQSYKEFFGTLGLQLQNSEEYWKQLVLKNEELKISNKETQERIQIRKAEIEEIQSKRIKLRENRIATEERIKQKIKKHKNWVTEQEKILKELNSNFEDAWKKHEKLRGTKESLKRQEIDLQNKIDDVKKEKEHASEQLSLALKESNEAKERKESVSKSLEIMITKREAFEQEGVRLDQELAITLKIKEDHMTQIDSCKSKLEEMKLELNEIVLSNESKQEEIEKLRTLLQEKRLQQEALKSDYRTKIEELKSHIAKEEKKSANLDLELQREEQTAKELLEKLKNNKETIEAKQKELELVTEDFAKHKKIADDLQIMAVVEQERYMKAKEEMKQREICLKELQISYDEVDKSHEEVRLRLTREKSEAEQDLKNAQREIENTTAHCEWIKKQTMSCVDECKLNYARHVDEKEAALKACKADFLLLKKKEKEATAEKDAVKNEYTQKMKELENEAKQLQEQLRKKKEMNQRNADSNLVNFSPLLPEQNQRSILKSSMDHTDAAAINKRVKFTGLSSESDSEPTRRVSWRSSQGLNYVISTKDSEIHLPQPAENRQPERKFFQKPRSHAAKKRK